MATAIRSALNTVVDAELVDALESAIVEDDAMDAPADWDAGNVTFDPYV